jgi:hypothetical protein
VLGDDRNGSLVKGVGIDRGADEFLLEKVAGVRVGGLELA